MDKVPKKCKFCNETFFTNRITKVFCSDKCAYLNSYSTKRKPSIKKICSICKKEFLSSKSSHIYCSQKCASKSYIIKTGRFSSLKHLPSSTVGAISELVVGSDLLKKGYEVYRPLSPSCSADLLVEKDNKILKIEVRTAYQGINGKLCCSKQNIKAPILAKVLLNKGEIIYFQKTTDKEIFL